jgi:hypothetical protein
VVKKVVDIIVRERLDWGMWWLGGRERGGRVERVRHGEPVRQMMAESRAMDLELKGNEK